MRVFFADDEIKVRSALRLLLEQETRALVMVGEAADARSLLAQAQAAQPDLVLLDWELPGLRPNGHAAVVESPGALIVKLHELCPTLKIIALSGSPEARREVLEAGADEFICKVDSPERLVEVLHTLEAQQEQGAS